MASPPPQDSNFNPRSPRGERRLFEGEGLLLLNISIHAPREGSDLPGVTRFTGINVFQSTLPARGATLVVLLVIVVINISIHAPREGSDASCNNGKWRVYSFQPTLPARGATGGWPGCPGRRPISIHAPREGSDVRV